MDRRWLALAIIFASFIQFTLNWFAIIPMFPNVLADLGLSPLQLGGIVSAFIAGYGIFHLPAGILAERWGMRRALLAGIAIEAAGALLSAATQSYGLMLAARFVCGVGGSIYIGSAVGLTTAWFRDRYLATANGLVTGVAFSLGAAIGLFGWGVLAAHVGWRVAIALGAGVSALTFAALIPLYPEPPAQRDQSGHGPQHSMASLRRVVTAAPLWVMSAAFLGGYGSYFSATALLPRYAEQHAGASPAAAHMLGATMLLSGIVGSFLGGWLSDKVLGMVPTFLIGCAIEAAALFSVPFLDLNMLPVAAGLIGMGTIMAFVTWIGLPGLLPQQLRGIDIPSAAGLMLTVVALGGVAIPPLYATVSEHYGSAAGWLLEAALGIGFSLLSLLVRLRQTTLAAA